jgi:DNA-dependent RNA polymerase auxiliary subunit epsilon
MTLTETVAKNIIAKLLKGDDYRIEIITLINAEFLQYAIDFFKKVVDAKLKNKNITTDWYKAEFLSDKLNSTDIAINSGLNKKTISNMYNSTRREIVLEASSEHYDKLYEAIKTLVDEQDELNITLTLKFRDVSVDLNVSESLIVINTLAVKRAALRGGLWSTAGKRVEKPLMKTLCHLYGVPEENYNIIPKNKYKKLPAFEREIDFYLNSDNNHYKCEVKLMGKGNPESADVVIARDSKVFVADKLSETNKSQLDSLGVEWVELRCSNGYRKFEKVLKKLKIPFTGDGLYVEDKLQSIFSKIFE